MATMKRLTQWWNSEGVAYAVCLGILSPGIVTACVEWHRTGDLCIVERLLCCFGLGCVASTLFLVAAALFVHRKEIRK